MPAPKAKASKVPVPKVAAAGVSGAATVIVVYVAGLLGLDIPAEVASALTALISFGGGWLKE